MILAIVGSTDLTIPQRFTAKLVIRGLILQYDAPPVISGGAYGIDQIAEGIALAHHCWKHKHLPKYARWEPEGYKDRNMLIAHECTVLWSIRNKHSKTYGSGWTADYAESIGKEVHRLILP